MEEKDDQSPRVEPSTPPSNPTHGLKTSDGTLPLNQSIRPGSSILSDSSQAEEFRIDIEEEKKEVVDLNALFPGKGYDLNRLFPDEGTKKLLFELKRNKREIERFIKNLDLEEK